MINDGETLRRGLRGAFLLERFMWLGFAPDVSACLETLRATLPSRPLLDASELMLTRKSRPTRRIAADEANAEQNKTLMQLIARSQQVKSAALWSPLLTAFELAERNLALSPAAGPFANHPASSAEISSEGEAAWRWFLTDPDNGGLLGRVLVRSLVLPFESIQALVDWPNSSWRTVRSNSDLMHFEGVVDSADVRMLGLSGGTMEVTVRGGEADSAISVFDRLANRLSQNLPKPPAGGLPEVVTKHLTKGFS